MKISDLDYLEILSEAPIVSGGSCYSSWSPPWFKSLFQDLFKNHIVKYIVFPKVSTVFSYAIAMAVKMNSIQIFTFSSVRYSPFLTTRSDFNYPQQTSSLYSYSSSVIFM